MAENFIKKIHLKKGALTAQAKRAGKTIPEFCSESGHRMTTKKRCVLAKTFANMRKNK